MLNKMKATAATTSAGLQTVNRTRLSQNDMGWTAKGSPPNTESARVLRAEGRTEAAPPRFSANGLSVLIVDDDPSVLNACNQIAAGIGFKVYTANTAEQARAFVGTHAPDVVLMDLKMPGGGLTLLEEIRAQRPRSSIVVMTAYATVTSAVEAMRIGATDYLTKPFAMDDLLSTLERAGERRSYEIGGQSVKSSPVV